MPQSSQFRATRVRLFGGLPLLVAMLLGLLQTGMPLAHALLHAAARAQVRQISRGVEPGFQSTLAEERTCPLCAADEVPALPEPRPAQVPLRGMRACPRAQAATERPTAPLEVFCRPPPAA